MTFSSSRKRAGLSPGIQRKYWILSISYTRSHAISEIILSAILPYRRQRCTISRLVLIPIYLHRSRIPDAGKRIRSRIFSNRGFFPVYDTKTLVRGFAIAFRDNPALRLTLKGDGPEEEEVRELVSALGLGNQITFRKRTAYSDVPRDYQDADIFITTSISDGTPVSVLEAMASGLPCIATSVGGIPEWIEHKVTGLLIQPGSPEQVAEAILSLARDPQLRERLGTAARNMIVKNGQWNTLMAQAEKDYLALTETYRQDRP